MKKSSFNNRYKTMHTKLLTFRLEICINKSIFSIHSPFSENGAQIKQSKTCHQVLEAVLKC